MELEPRRIHRISEGDIDGVIDAAGGTKIDDLLEIDGVQSADYRLGEAVIELKIIEEEGLEKPERQRKIAALFGEQYPDYPVVVVHPYLLVPERRKKLFRILEGPIKTQVKKASKQLAASAAKFQVSGRVLIIFNNGYMSLVHEDFKSLVLKCVRNDTSQIDHVIVAGMYYEYDGFDNYFNVYFDHCPIDASREIDLEGLDAAWSKFVTGYMDGFVKARAEPVGGRLPNKDISFDVSGRTFVRPRGQVGKTSVFFPHGRPRKNSSGVDRCPPVAIVVPSVRDEEWELLGRVLKGAGNIPESFRSSGTEPSHRESEDKLRPNVKYEVAVEPFAKMVRAGEVVPTLESFKLYACDEFSKRVRELADQAQELPENIAVGGRYILVGTVEIGSDQANDFSSVLLVSEIPGFESSETVVENERIFFEHALCLGASYAIRYGCSAVFTTKNTEFGWV